MKIREETGSIAPLGIGLCLISISAIVISTNSASLFIFQKRLTTAAEAIVVESNLGNSQLDDLAAKLFGKSIEGLQIKLNKLDDGATRQVVACAHWRAPVPTILISSDKKICTHAEARSG